MKCTVLFVWSQPKVGKNTSNSKNNVLNMYYLIAGIHVSRRLIPVFVFTPEFLTSDFIDPRLCVTIKFETFMPGQMFWSVNKYFHEIDIHWK